MSKTIWWISLKLLFSRRSLFGGSSPFAFIGLVLGVAALVVSMGVFAGFESTLKNSMIDVSGHVQIVKRSRFQDDWQELVLRIKQAEPDLLGAGRFIFLEAVTAHRGKISGILIQGLDVEHTKEVLNFSSRVIEGQGDLGGAHDGVPAALIGRGLAKKLGLKVGDQFRAVVPVASSSEASEFRRKVGVFQVRGILELGKFEWNERFVMTDLATAQEIAEIGDRYTGLVLKFKDAENARQSAFRLSQILGAPYWVRDWRESNENLFQAIAVERVVIFFVVFIIVIVAAFNIASTLYVSVMQRYSDIAILKTIGMPERQVRQIFSIHGVVIGALGLGAGFILGWLLCLGFTWVEAHYSLMAGSVYKVEGIAARLRLLDLLAISVATLLICFVATLAPAKKGARLTPVEGLRYG